MEKAKQDSDYFQGLSRLSGTARRVAATMARGHIGLINIGTKKSVVGNS